MVVALVLSCLVCRGLGFGESVLGALGIEVYIAVYRGARTLCRGGSGGCCVGGGDDMMGHIAGADHMPTRP